MLDINMVELLVVKTGSMLDEKDYMSAVEMVASMVAVRVDETVDLMVSY